MKFQIDSMTCGGCARSVTATLKEVDAAATVEIDLPGKTVSVTSSQPPQAFASALDAVGFPAQLRAD